MAYFHSDKIVGFILVFFALLTFFDNKPARSSVWLLFQSLVIIFYFKFFLITSNATFFFLLGIFVLILVILVGNFYLSEVNPRKFYMRAKPYVQDRAS